jgi:hypothetical protein
MPKTITGPPPAAVARDAHWSAKMDALRARKPIEASVTVPLDPEAKTDLDKAEMELALARGRAEHESGKDAPDSHPLVAKAAKVVAAAQERVEASTITLGFRGLPRDVYEKLMADHPPTADQEAKGEIYNVDTFPPALISACSVDGMPLADAEELVRGWNQAEVAALFHAAIYVNTTSRVDLGKG